MSIAVDQIPDIPESLPFGQWNFSQKIKEAIKTIEADTAATIAALLLNDLYDTDAGAPANNDYIAYNSVTGKWENVVPGIVVADSSFKTITGITNDVVADSPIDTLTLATANNRLSIVGTSATDTITFTINQGNIDHNSLAGIQGGAAGDYYHLTVAHHTDLTDGNNCGIHKHDDRYYTEGETDILLAAQDALSELVDVVITGPADLDVLQYDNGTSKWVDRTFAEAGISAAGHTHDGRYFTEAEHINASGGAGDAGKPIKLDAAGLIDGTMIAGVAGDVTGPGVSTDNAVVRFDGAGGKTLQNSLVIITDTGQMGINKTVPVGILHTYEDNALVDNTAGVTIEQDGAGDATLHFLLTGGMQWTMGIDNSSSDKFVIAENDDLAASARFVIHSGGAVGICWPTMANALLAIAYDGANWLRYFGNNGLGPGVFDILSSSNADPVIYIEHSGTADFIELHDGANTLFTISAAGNVVLAAGTTLSTDEVRAVDAGGLYLRDDSGTLGIFIEDGGQIGFGTDVPTYDFHFIDSDTTAASVGAVLRTDMAFSGNAAANIIQNAHYLKTTSTVVGTQADGTRQTFTNLVVSSKVSTPGNIYHHEGLYLVVKHNHTTDTTNLYAGRAFALNTSTGTVTESRGLYSIVGNQSTGALTAAYGLAGAVWGIGAGTIGSAYGVYSDIWRSAGTITTGFLFYGSFTGAVTNKYGIYLEGETYNYLTGMLGIGGVLPGAMLDINSDVLRLRTAKTPAAANAAGNAGDFCWDATYFYICVAANTWERTQHVSW